MVRVEEVIIISSSESGGLQSEVLMLARESMAVMEGIAESRVA